MSQPPTIPPAPTMNYASPPSGEQLNLRKIAGQQKGVIFCILAELVLMACSFAVKGGPAGAIIALAYLASLVTATVFIFMLAIELYNTGIGVVLGLLTLIPLIGLIVLLVVNNKATTILKEHGIKVGLLGATLPSVPPAPR